jgi:polygalacturonase
MVPNMTKDWIVRPIKLAGDQEPILDDGVAITAKRGEYRGGGDSVFTAQDVSNLTIRGYGAAIRRQKEDYIHGRVLADLKWDRQLGQYPRAEWRMTLSLRGATNVKVYGVTLRDSDCDNHYRQGISVISVDGLLVENSVFRNTWGTPPSAGVDIEPDTPAERIRDVVFRNCRFEDNYGDGIEIFLAHLKPESGDVSILFDNCRVTSRRGTGIRVTKIAGDGPGGLVEFRHCTVENTEDYGIKVQDKSARRARVRFVNCAVRNTANNRMFAGAWTPLWLHLFRPELTTRHGGIDFVNCAIEDDHDRPVIVVEDAKGAYSLVDVTGSITDRNPYGVRTTMGARQEGVTLAVTEVK